MPRAWDSNLVTHINGEVLTIATCWKVTRHDGHVFRFTDHDKDVLIELDVTAPNTHERYEAASGYTRSSIVNKSDFSVDSLDAEGVIDNILDTLLTSYTITERDLRAGLFDDAEVLLFIVDWRLTADPNPLPKESEIGILRKGNLGAVSIQDEMYKTELRGLMQQLQTSVGAVYSPLCRVDLFSTKCGLTASEFQQPGSVGSVTDNREFAATTRLTIERRPVPTTNRVDLDLTDQFQVIEDSGTDTDSGEYTSTLETPDGTEENPILVSTSTHVDDIRDAPWLHYRLTQNVDMSGHGLFEPLPGFSGVLDGAGYEIQNLDMDDSGGSPRTYNSGYGFFSSVTQAGVVRRLGLELAADVRPAPGSSVYLGAFAGRILGTVEDCYVLGVTETVNADDTSQRSGGFCGSINSVYTYFMDSGYADVPRPGTCTRCYCAIGRSGSLGANDGAFVGQVGVVETAVQDYNYFDSTVAGTSQKGTGSTATALTTAQIKVAANLTGFDFETVWKDTGAGSYNTLLDPGRGDAASGTPTPFLRYEAIDLTSLGTYQTGSITWVATEPGASSIDVYIALDGETFSSTTSGGVLPLLVATQSLTDVFLTVRVDFTPDGTNVPTLETLSINVQSESLSFPDVPEADPPPVDLEPSDDDWFVDGLLTFTSGKNAGLAREVKGWTPGSLTFKTYLGFPFDVIIGDEFTALPGCKKRLLPDCRDKLDNILNFRGEPFVPGSDKLHERPDTNRTSGEE